MSTGINRNSLTVCFALLPSPTPVSGCNPLGFTSSDSSDSGDGQSREAHKAFVNDSARRMKAEARLNLIRIDNQVWQCHLMISAGRRFLTDLSLDPFHTSRKFLYFNGISYLWLLHATVGWSKTDLMNIIIALAAHSESSSSIANNAINFQKWNQSTKFQSLSNFLRRHRRFVFKWRLGSRGNVFISQDAAKIDKIIIKLGIFITNAVIKSKLKTRWQSSTMSTLRWLLWSLSSRSSSSCCLGRAYVLMNSPSF